jgi:stearoyl-CoA desaturase (Delta-9 desaturase)
VTLAAQPEQTQPETRSGPKPVLAGTRGLPQQIGVYVFVFTPWSRCWPPSRWR